MRRWLLAVLAALALAAPSPAAGLLRVALQLEPPTLDPTAGAAAAIDDVTYHTIFEGLTRLDTAGRAHPLLATGWTMAPDMKSYVFRLRRGVRFQDGAPFDAGAVAYSIGRAIAPGSLNAQAQALSEIEGVDIVDAATVRIRLRTPDASLPVLLALPDAAMVSRASVAKLATDPIGTGPFRFASWARGDRLRLVRSESYWGAKPSLGGLEFRFIADPSAAYAAIKGHEVDIIPAYPAPENLDALAGDPSLRVSTGPSQAEVILALNNARPPFGDIRVRRAIGLAIDRKAIIDGAMYGHATPIGSHFPPQDLDYVDLTGLSPHRPAEARALLAAAGFPNGFDLQLALPPPSYARRAGEIIAAQLGAVGIRVRIVPIEWAQWLDQVFARHDYQATIVAHVEPFDYEIYGRRDYYLGYDGRAVASLVARLRATADPGARHALLGAIQRRIAEDAPAAFLFQFPRLSVADARLEHVWIDTPLQMADYAAARFEGGDAGEETATAGRPWGVVALAGLAVAALLAGMRMGSAWLVKRAGVFALTLLTASVIIFVLLSLAPGDPAQFMLGIEARPEMVARLRQELGLGGSAPARYLRWIGGLVRGDPGMSYAYRVPVAGLIGPRLAVSLPLAVLSLGLAIVIGVGGAVAAMRRPGGVGDRISGGLAAIGVAVPNFWLGLLLLLGGTVRLGLRGIGGFPGWQAIGPALGALALPALALGLPQAAVLFRVARTAIAEELTRDYVRTARAKGLGGRAILIRHVLPNALPPILTIVGLQLPFLFAGGVIVENVFHLPGLGRLVIQAVEARDLILVQAIVMLLVAITAGMSILVDVAHAAADPRLRRR